MSEPILFGGCLTPLREASHCRLCLLGIADDSQSSFLTGCALAPDVIRNAYDGRCFNSTSESGVCLAGKVEDRGNVYPVAQGFSQSVQRYRSSIRGILQDAKVPFVCGGDHAITPAVVSTLCSLEEPIHVVQVDAHPDLYPIYAGNPHSHACAAFKMLNMEHVQTVTQLGIRADNEEQARQARSFGDRLNRVQDVGLSDVWRASRIPDDALIYVTVDLDGIDPAFAPGVSHPVPGGWTSRQVLDLIKSLPGRLAGMDVVEVNPSKDINNSTAILAARILHQGMALAYSQQSS